MYYESRVDREADVLHVRPRRLHTTNENLPTLNAFHLRNRLKHH